MAYTVKKWGNDTQGISDEIQVEDGKINLETDLQLVGRDYYGYGEAIAQNFVDLLENFAQGQPTTPILGQIWYDEPNGVFKFYDGNVWTPFSANIRTIVVQNSDGNTLHNLTVIYDSVGGNTVPICVFSADEEFTMDISPAHNPTVSFRTDWNGGDTTAPKNTIYKGLNLKDGMKMHGIATQAQYADLAELYASDAEYTPGTVLKIGGEAEVTQTSEALCMEVFGVVSSNPAYLMNSAMQGTSVPVALEGRVPVRVIGEVKKGQRLVASETPGVARGVTKFEHAEGDDWFRMVGRALEDKTTLGEGLVEAVVGAK